MSAADLLTQAPEVQPAEAWPEPLPLYRDPEAPEPYPIAALGPLEPLAREIIRVVQAPDALVAGSLLATASYAAQGLANLALDGRVYPLSLFLLTVAESGERKSAVDEVATAPIRERQKALHLAQQDELSLWEGRVALYEAERKRIIGSKRLDRTARERELEALGSPPAKPWGGILLTSEPTYEGLVRLLAEGWPAAGLFSSEGGSFLGGHAMGKEHRLRTIAGLSELWDGRPIDRVRVGDGANLLYGRRLALHLMAQPIVARELISDPLAQGQGFMARVLTAAPTSTAGTRFYVEADVYASPAYQVYAARLGLALETVERNVLDKEDSRRTGLSLPVVGLSPEAKRLWVAFYDHVEGNAKGELSQIRGFSSKLPEHALRLAGALALLENPGLNTLGREQVERGITLAQYYGAEALRLVGGYRIPRELALAGEVLSWLVAHCKAKDRHLVHLAEVYRLGPPAVRSAASAREVIRTLEAHGWVAHRPNAEVEGIARRDAWEVNPRALPQV